MKLKRLRWIPILACAIILAGMTSACGIQSQVTIGTQTYTESKILAEMYRALIEDRTGLSE